MDTVSIDAPGLGATPIRISRARGYSPRRSALSRFLVFVAMPLVLTACGGGGGSNGGPAPTPASQVAVPNVAGMTQAAATTSITDAGVVVGTITMASSATVPAGSVISESPAAATMVGSGSPVDLTVSSGPAQVAVPNVVGMTQAAATSAITAAGLAVGTVTMAISATVPSGSVITESPGASTSVATGSSVNLSISTGPATVSVPNVIGLTQAAATTEINAAGLTVGTVTSANSATVPSGSVISESPLASTSVISGTAVSFVISSASPTVTSLTIAPNASSLLLNANLQFFASGQYSDGTVKDVTNLVAWSSSAPSVASISSTGLLNGVSAGGAKIFATLGSVQGGTAVTIGASSTGFTLISDVTDSRLLTYTDTDGSIVTFFGSRDATGLPTTSNTVIVTFADQSSETIQLDAEQRPALISLSKGGQISLDWTSPTAAILTATSPDGSAQATTALNLATMTAQASTLAANKLKTMFLAPTRRLVARTTSASDTASNQQISVHVQTCGQPEDQATVIFNKVGQFGGNPQPGVAQGGGLYTADLSSGGGGLSLGQLASAAQSAVSTACNALGQAKYGGVEPPELNTEMCVAITAAIDAASGGLAVPESVAIQAACIKMGVGLNVLQNGCDAEQAIVDATTSVLDYYLANTTFGVQATASVQGIGTFLESTDNVGPQGPFTVTPITFSCPAVSAVTVAPPALTLIESGTAPVTAEIDGSLGIIRSSGVTPTWTPASGAEATVAPNPPALSATGVPIGVSSATVTAGNIPTGKIPVDVTATFKGVSGTAQVTITAPVSLQISPTLAAVTVGSTATLNVTATSGGASIPTPPNLEWSSDAESVATVINGVVTGVSAGPATITVTDPVSMATASATVTVGAIVLQISPASATVAVGSTTTLAVTASDASGAVATPPDLQWTSSNTSIATVAAGVVRGVAQGNTTITVTDPMSLATTSAMITVAITYPYPAPGWPFNPPSTNPQVPTILSINYSNSCGGTSSSQSTSEYIKPPFRIGGTSESDISWPQFSPIDSTTVLTFFNGASEAQGHPDNPSPQYVGTYPLGSYTGSGVNVGAEDTYTASIAGNILSEQWIGKLEELSSTETQNSSYTYTSTYNVVTGVQTYTYSYVLVSNAVNGAGCQFTATVTEQGSTSYNWFTN
jgi:beta-lactam-binding protein with PASTA domain